MITEENNASFLLEPFSEYKHIVGQCRWQSIFDDEQEAYQLQEYLSYFSNVFLLGILEDVFESINISGKTWRIDCLILDLGTLDYTDLPTQLPLRIKNCLLEQLELLLKRHPEYLNDTFEKLPEAPTLIAQQTLEMLPSGKVLNDFLRCFLQQGRVPWWYQGQESNLQVLEQKLQQAPEELAALIWELGQTESVRKRMAWQWPNREMIKIITLLEPYHYTYIIEFFDSLKCIQKNSEYAERNVSDFERYTWFWILTHLLVERGSLFNNRIFVESTLRKLAKQYKLDFHTVLQQMVNAAQSLQYLGQVTPNFIQAIFMVHQQTLSSVDNVLTSQKVKPIDYWQLLSNCLSTGYSQGKQSVCVGGETINLAELLVLLCTTDRQKLTRILKQKGREARVRQQLLALLNESGLIFIVELLAPKDHLFIVVHAKKVQAAPALQHSSGQFIWSVILAHLLVDAGSQFNRRQFVYETLLKISQSRGISYQTLVNLLLASPLGPPQGNQSFELLCILHQLQQEHNKRQPSADLSIDDYADALLYYLRCGKVLKISDSACLEQPAVIFSLLLWQHPQQINKVIETLLNHHLKPFKPKSVWLNTLLELCAGKHYERLLYVLSPRAADFNRRFIDQLLYCQQRQCLPALGELGCRQQWQQIVLDALLSNRQTHFSVHEFLSTFRAILCEQYGVKHSIWLNELSQCQLKKQPDSVFDQQILQWLSSEKVRGATKPVDLTIVADTEEFEHCTVQQRMQLLLACLRDRKGLQSVSQSVDINYLFVSLLSNHSAELLDLLARQNDSKSLLQRIVVGLNASMLQQSGVKQWLSDLSGITSVQEGHLLKQWQGAMQESCLWRGSSSLLKNKLHEIYYLCVLDSALQGKNNSGTELLLAAVIKASCEYFNCTLTSCLAALQQQTILSGEAVWKNTQYILAAELNDGAENVPENKENKAANNFKKVIALVADGSLPTFGESSKINQFSIDKQGHYLKHPMFNTVLLSLLQYGRLPLWLNTSEGLSLSILIQDLLKWQPQQLLKQLRSIIDRSQLHSAVMTRLTQLLNYKELLAAVIKTEAQQSAQILILEDFYEGLETLQFEQSKLDLIKLLLVEKTVECWLSDDWEVLYPENIVNNIACQLIQQYGIDGEKFYLEIKDKKQCFPAELMHVDEEKNLSGITTLVPSQTVISVINPPKIKKQAGLEIDNNLPIFINNAGLVVFQSFIVRYFTRLNLIENDKFVSFQAQCEAVHYLQYLVTGQSETEEQHLILNKVLCGLELDSVVASGIDINEEKADLAEGLLAAMINYWEAIGASSVDGFRGNWLVREGSLNEHDDKWELFVEKKSYDLLLDRAPFSYALSRLPWMKKPLYVSWS